MGIELIDDQFNALMNEFDVDKNNLIEIDEFMNMLFSNINSDDKRVIEAVRNVLFVFFKN
jgi:Ca2+-binding EF-hand superfamily protein